MTDRLGRRRNPKQDEALRRRANPEGVVSRSHNVAAPEEPHNWYATLPAKERGEIIARAHKRATSKVADDHSSRLHVRLSDSAVKRAIRERAADLGLGVGAYLEGLALEDLQAEDAYQKAVEGTVRHTLEIEL